MTGVRWRRTRSPASTRILPRPLPFDPTSFDPLVQNERNLVLEEAGLSFLMRSGYKASFKSTSPTSAKRSTSNSDTCRLLNSLQISNRCLDFFHHLAPSISYKHTTMTSWTPLKTGSPCWLQIEASDVGRGSFPMGPSLHLNKTSLDTLVVLVPNVSLAKEFYRSVFDWTFKPMPSKYAEDEIAMFSFPDEKFQHLGGGIVKSDGDPTSRSRNGTLLYLYVNDIEEMIAVSPFLHTSLQG